MDFATIEKILGYNNDIFKFWIQFRNIHYNIKSYPQNLLESTTNPETLTSRATETLRSCSHLLLSAL